MIQILQATLVSLWPVLALAGVLVLLGAVLRHPRFKGWRGERRVQRLLRIGLDPHQYVDLHNVTLPTADGSTQIDHLIFSPYGLFVLETKNLQGWIFGSERQAEWTQKLHPRHSQKFQNPLRQNDKHVQALQTLLEIPREQLHSVVAFVGTSTFKTEMPPQVTQGAGVVAYIHCFQQPVWAPDVMQAWMDRLEQVRLQPTRATHRQHVAHVQATQADKAQRKAVRRAASAPATPAPVATASPTPQQRVAAPVLREVVEAPVALALPQMERGQMVQRPQVSPATDAARMAAAPQPAAVVPDKPDLSATAALPPAAAPHTRAACPQCQAPLRGLRMQRGPLAGQVVYRCSNAALCQYVQVPA